MQAGLTVDNEPLRRLGGDLDTHRPHRSPVLLEPVARCPAQPVQHRCGELAATQLLGAGDRAQGGDGHQFRDDGLRSLHRIEGQDPIAQPQIVIHVEEHLSYRIVRFGTEFPCPECGVVVQVTASITGNSSAARAAAEILLNRYSRGGCR